MRNRLLWFTLLAPFALPAQELKDVIARLDRLEQENRELRQEVAELRTRLAPQAATDSPVPLEERVAIVERRTEEQAQTKVAAAQRLPVRLNGMLLVNTYWNGRHGTRLYNPLNATPSISPSNIGSGASLSQTILGVQMDSLHAFGAKITADASADFWGADNDPLDLIPRFRTGMVRLDWKDTQIAAGHEKPLISPRNPESLAQVAFPALAASGNLWVWQPQVRLEQRWRAAATDTLRFQGAYYPGGQSSVYTSGSGNNVGWRDRSAGEVRVEWRHEWNDAQRVELAGGFHGGSSDAGSTSLDARLFSADWLIAPLRTVQFSGLYYQGRNLPNLSAGKAFVVTDTGLIQTAQENGGFGQLSWDATSRLGFHVFGGANHLRNRVLGSDDIRLNASYAANAIYRLTSNVLFSFEASQVRTTYTTGPARLHNHYDLALAYLF